MSDPKMELRGNTILITYDILNSTPSEEFSVELRVNDTNGKMVNATALTGDIGDVVSGGYNKRIVWDLELDKIEMNASIYVKVYVKALPPPEPVVVAPEEAPESVPEEPKVAATDELNKQYSRTGLMVQSLAFPGLGLSRYKGGVHWIKGVAGYACITGAVVMNRKAISTYEGISDLNDFDEKNELYQDALNQDKLSETLAYIAIGIWVTDLVWTLVGTSDMKQSASNNKGLRIDPAVDPVSNAPMIAFTYKF